MKIDMPPTEGILYPPPPSNMPHVPQKGEVAPSGGVALNGFLESMAGKWPSSRKSKRRSYVVRDMFSGQPNAQSGLVVSQDKMMTMQQRKNKRGMQQLSDAQKIEAITKVQKGETKAAVAREFGVPESTLRGWCKKAKLNGHCHSALNKSLQVTSTMSPVLMTPAEMAYRDCGYSKGSGSEDGSPIHPFSDEQEDEDVKPSVVIPEEQRRVLDWLNYGHYPQLAAQTTAATTTTTTTPPSTNHDNKPAQPVVTSSTCDDIVKPIPKLSKAYKKNHNNQNSNNSSSSNNNNNNNNCSNNRTQNVSTKNVGFYNWCKTNTNTSTAGEGSISPSSSEKMDSYDDEPLALIVPSKRRFSDLETSFKNELDKMCCERPPLNNNNNNNSISNNNCSSNGPLVPHHGVVENGFCNSINISNNHHHHHHITITHNNAAANTNENNNDNLTMVNDNDAVKQTISVEEALKHGEVFLDWLKECSHPNVTVLHSVQIGTLLKNLRSSLERSQSRR